MVFVQPGRVVRVLFVLLSDWEAADWGKEELDFLCVLSGARLRTLLVWWGGRGVYDGITSLCVSGH